MPNKADPPVGRSEAPVPPPPPPYLHCLEHRGRLAIWQVDGDYVRKNINEEFSNFGHHWTIKEIPEGEIWLDQEGHPDEQRFFVRHALVERTLMERGKSYEQARVAADSI